MHFHSIIKLRKSSKKSSTGKLENPRKITPARVSFGGEGGIRTPSIKCTGAPKPPKKPYFSAFSIFTPCGCPPRKTQKSSKKSSIGFRLQALKGEVDDVSCSFKLTTYSVLINTRVHALRMSDNVFDRSFCQMRLGADNRNEGMS